MAKFGGIESPQDKHTLNDKGNDAERIASQTFACEVCGRPCERRRRKDLTWYHYKRCRGCRRLPSHGHLLGNTIKNQRLSSLVFALYHHLAILKQEKWQGTPKTQVVHGLRMLLAVLKDD